MGEYYEWDRTPPALDDAEYMRGYDAGFSAGYHEFLYDARYETVHTPYAHGWIAGHHAARTAVADSAGG